MKSIWKTIAVAGLLLSALGAAGAVQASPLQDGGQMNLWQIGRAHV